MKNVGLVVAYILVVVSRHIGTFSGIHCSKPTTLQWRHYERQGVSNHQLRVYLLNRLLRQR